MQQADNLCYRIMEQIDTPRALTVYLLVKSKELGQLKELQTDPLHYDSPLRFAKDHFATSFLRKSEWLEADGVALEKQAVTAWYSSEHQCFRTNLFLSRLPSVEGPYAEHTRAILARARRWIGLVLGRIPLELEPRFGPGSNVSIPSRRCDVISKISHRNPTATPSLSGWDVNLRHFLWPGPFWAMVRGNEFFTVPKDWKGRRACAKEPLLNGALQLAAGRHMRRRLLRVGLDLGNQEIHRELARCASLDGNLATLDLSAASDTICRSLVEELLPPDWYSLLDDLRSSHTKVEGRWVRLEKFSSMGNGFTFELETLIFAGIIHGVTGLDVSDSSATRGFSVYGDDIVVPSDTSQDVAAALATFGFTLNKSKSFTAGPFRESCGGDFFLGRDVRPYRAGVFPMTPSDWFDLHNGLYDWLKRQSIDSPGWVRLLRSLKNEVPSRMRLHVASELGNLGFHGGTPLLKVVDSIRYMRVVRSVPLTRWQIRDTHYAVISQYLGYRFDLDWRGKRFLVRRGVEYVYRVGWTPFS